MIYTIFYNPHANIAASPTTNQSSIREQLDPLPFEVIMPLTEEEWKDEEYAYGELYDKIHSTLSAHAANLRRQLQKCSDSWQYQQIKKMAEVAAALCEISLKFDESAEYPT